MKRSAAVVILLSLLAACGDGPKCTDPAIHDAFMSECVASGGNGSAGPCSCVWYQLADRYECAEVDRVSFRELTEMVQACTGPR